jgi:hypothetical protein
LNTSRSEAVEGDGLQAVRYHRKTIEALAAEEILSGKEDVPQRLNVKFQEVVVHSIENCEADVAKQKHSQEIEWTITIMLD